MTTAFQSGAFQADSFQIDAAPSTNYTLTCQPGSYVLTGQDATLLRSKSITAQAGAYAVTGVDAAVKVDKKLTALAGSYSVTGQSATITRTGGTTNYTLTCQSGAYLIGADYWDDGYAEPGYAGNASITITPAQMQDTHDGWWAKQWQKKKKKPEQPIEEAVEELVEEVIAKAQKPKAKVPVPLPNTALQRAELIEQILVQLMDDEEEFEIEMLLL